MPIELPKPIADYFDADRGSRTEAFADCFTADAIVRDDGHTHAGRDAICRWKDEYSAKFTSTAEPFSVLDEEGRTVVASHVAGDFPGSPIDLRYFFVLDDDKIAELEIKP
jgi:hypothetical protein